MAAAGPSGSGGGRSKPKQDKGKGRGNPAEEPAAAPAVLPAKAQGKTVEVLVDELSVWIAKGEATNQALSTLIEAVYATSSYAQLDEIRAEAKKRDQASLDFLDVLFQQLAAQKQVEDNLAIAGAAAAEEDDAPSATPPKLDIAGSQEKHILKPRASPAARSIIEGALRSRSGTDGGKNSRLLSQGLPPAKRKKHESARSLKSEQDEEEEHRFAGDDQEESDAALARLLFAELNGESVDAYTGASATAGAQAKSRKVIELSSSEEEDAGMEIDDDDDDF